MPCSNLFICPLTRIVNNTQGRRRFLLGDYVSVTNASPYSNICTAKLGRASIKRKRDWVAHIVDIRGTSPVDVHALVIWMYWPEALPRRGKRGKEYQENELVASNHRKIDPVSLVLRPLTCYSGSNRC